ncbi:MAG: RluA family pseudouridine synthase [Rhodospirillales bacterium]
MAGKDTGGGARHPVAAFRADAGKRLDRFIAERLPALSRSRVKVLIQSGNVAAAGAEAVARATIKDPSLRVKPGQSFAIFVPDSAPAAPRPQALPLAVVYEDEDLIVIDKQAGMVVHPAPGNPEATLVNALLAHCGDTLAGVGGVKRPGIVHRLDKDTSGLLVAAKNDLAHASLSKQFAERTVDRLYSAVVWGVPRPAQGEIAAAIGRDPRNRKRMAAVTRGGKKALTRYRTVKTLGQGIASLVECRLGTGRTHQVRVHLAEIGHPLVGDPVYAGRRGRKSHAGEAAATTALVLGRQALHASVLGFRHPRTGQQLHFKSILPNDINMLIKSLDKP